MMKGQISVSDSYFIRSILFLSTGLLLLFNWGCGDPVVEDVDIDFGYGYFPLAIGQYYEYEMDSIIYDPEASGTNVIETKSFLREEIIDTLTDETGLTWYLIEQSYRQSINQDWQIRSIQRMTRNERNAFRKDDNLNFIKLVFPPSEGSTWDGNQFFDSGQIIPVAGESIELFKSWEYQILQRGVPMEVNGTTFDKVLEVSMADSENLIEYRSARELYADEIGLIYRELFILDTQCEICCNNDFAECEGLAWEEKSEKGFIVKQTLMDWN